MSIRISKRELFSKHALSPGLGLGALALMAQHASADTPFSSFAFAATGAPKPRTMPDRLAEIRSVKDFGAVGDGVTDDTAAIQATFDAAFGTSASPHGDRAYLNRPVYFPAGGYKITRPLILTRVKGAYIFGDGMNSSTIIWGSNVFPGNTLTGGNPNNSITPMIQMDGFAFSRITNLNFYFSNGQDKNSTCIYGFGNSSTSPVVLDFCSFAGASYGVLLGAGSPNNVSEWQFRGCRFAENGQAGVFIVGQNTLNMMFYSCGFAHNGSAPLTTVVTAKIDSGSGGAGTILNVTAVSSGPPLTKGLLLYSDTGNIRGTTTITETHADNGSRSGTGGPGTYSVSISQNVSNQTIKAMNLNVGNLVNLNGSMPIVHGCDMTNSPIDIVDYSSNNLSVQGIRSESLGLISIGGGTSATVDACRIVATGGTFTCTSSGTTLTVSAHRTGAGLFPGMFVYGSDGTNSLPNTGLKPPMCQILKQISGTPGGVGDYLMNQEATPGNLTSCTVTSLPPFLTCVGAGTATLNDCGAVAAVLVGSNNSQLRVRNNGFNPGGTSIIADLLRGFSGQILEYDVGSTQTYTVANLPTASSKFKGVRMFVIDSRIAGSGNFGAIVSGGGSNTVPVFCDGSNWRIG
jgi:hypothetical protein